MFYNLNAMYKYLVIILFWLLFVWTSQASFSYSQQDMFCTITKDNIVISLSSKNNYLCKTYIEYIEIQMKNVYKDILLIQKYIDKKQDIWYRNPLKQQKIDLLNNLQTVRLNILSHMKTFQNSLLETSRNYFFSSILGYQKKLNSVLNTLSKFQDKATQRYVLLLQEQLKTIDSINQAKTFDELNVYIKNYVYLKQQLEWK